LRPPGAAPVALCGGGREGAVTGQTASHFSGPCTRPSVRPGRRAPATFRPLRAQLLHRLTGGADDDRLHVVGERGGPGAAVECVGFAERVWTYGVVSLLIAVPG